jgi:hypothetical protein
MLCLELARDRNNTRCAAQFPHDPICNDLRDLPSRRQPFQADTP